jgi:hypothetical protein
MSKVLKFILSYCDFLLVGTVTVLLVLSISYDSIFNSELISAIGSAICITLLIYSFRWRIRLISTRNHRIYVALLYSIPIQDYLWLGLNEIRVYTYPETGAPSYIHSATIYIQDILQYICELIFVSVFIWTLILALIAIKGESLVSGACIQQRNNGLSYTAHVAG